MRRSIWRHEMGCETAGGDCRTLRTRRCLLRGDGMKWQHKLVAFGLHTGGHPREHLIRELERRLDELGSQGSELILFHDADESDRP